MRRTPSSPKTLLLPTALAGTLLGLAAPAVAAGHLPALAQERDAGADAQDENARPGATTRPLAELVGASVVTDVSRAEGREAYARVEQVVVDLDAGRVEALVLATGRTDGRRRLIGFLPEMVTSDSDGRPVVSLTRDRFEAGNAIEGDLERAIRARYRRSGRTEAGAGAGARAGEAGGDRGDASGDGANAGDAAAQERPPLVMTLDRIRGTRVHARGEGMDGDRGGGEPGRGGRGDDAPDDGAGPECGRIADVHVDVTNGELRWLEVAMDAEEGQAERRVPVPFRALRARWAETAEGSRNGDADARRGGAGAGAAEKPDGPRLAVMVHRTRRELANAPNLNRAEGGLESEAFRRRVEEFWGRDDGPQRMRGERSGADREGRRNEQRGGDRGGDRDAERDGNRGGSAFLHG